MSFKKRKILFVVFFSGLYALIFFLTYHKVVGDTFFFVWSLCQFLILGHLFLSLAECEESDGDSLITRFEHAEKTAKIGNWHVILEGYKVTWSKQMYKLFERDEKAPLPTIEEHRGRIHPDDLFLWEQAIKHLLEEGIPYKVRFRLKNSSGYIWIETNAAPLLDQKGRVIGAFGTSQDISESVQLTSEITRKDDSLSKIMDYVPLSVLYFDANGSCSYANDEWSRLTGQEHHEVLGDGWRSCVFEEDRPNVFGIAARFRKDAPEFLHFETRIIQTDRTGQLGEDKLMRVSGKVLRMIDETEGILLGFLVTLLDVTEVKQREKEVEETLRRLEIALSSGELGFWDWNLKTNEVTFDERWCSILGYKLSEIDSNMDFARSLVHPDDVDFVFTKVDEYLSGKIDDYELIMRMKHKNQTWIPVLTKGKIIERSSEGIPLRFAGTHMDFTKQKQIEDELREARDKAEAMSKVKSVFLANMSHEIRSPLNGIIGMAELLKGHVADQEGVSYLNSIYSCGHTLLQLIGDILDYSKMEAGRLELNPSKQNLKHIASEVALSFEGIRRKKELKFDFFWDKELSDYYYCDSIRIRQILFNLISNAFKFTHEGGVKLEVRKGENEEVLIRVSDSGVGIAHDKDHLLFQRFSQIDAGLDKSTEGTGLGLVIVKNLTNMMRGHITFESTVGKGTIFNVNLPLMKTSAPETASIDHHHDVKLKRCHILVAEDNPINQVLITKMLEALNQKVTLVANGEEALVAIENSREFDLILMDLQMPKLDGISATKILKQRHQDLPPVVAVTANAFAEDKLACQEAGMIDFISKPIKRVELRQILQKLIS